MLQFMIGAFIVLHGLVHGLYFGQSRRFFQLQPTLMWPDGSWAFSKLLGDEAARLLASLSLGLAAVGFLAAGVGIFLGQAWYRPVLIGSAAFSATLYLLFWDGKMQRLDANGGVGLLIDLVILVAVLIFRWLAFGF